MKSASQLAAQLYLAVWRWHFWMGLLIAPVLIIVSITGALYVFKPQIERWLHSDMLFVEVGEQHVGHSAFEQVLAEELPEAELHYISVSEEPDRSWAGFLEVHDESDPDAEEIVYYAYFNQYTGELLGYHPNDQGFFRVVLALHRRLMGGTFGRFAVEIATCWGIVSMLTGIYLWWPRKKEKLWGVWLPRIKGSFRTVLRDWHTVPGVYLALFVIAIMVTGLLFTRVWGTGFRIGVAVFGGFPEFYLSPPQSAPVDNHDAHERIGLDEAFAAANTAYPFEGRSYGIDLPHHDSDDAFNITTEISEPFADLGTAYIDQYTGEVLLSATSQDLPFMTHVVLMFYPIHVGSIFGLPTQIIALVSCLLIITMSITGVWMWWRRKPAGQWGAPKKTPPQTAPSWVVWGTVALAIFLPVVGFTLLAIFLFGWVDRLIRHSRAPTPAA